MSTEKHNRSESGERVANKKPRSGDAGYKSDQEHDPSTVFSEASGGFRVVIKLRSWTKALRNDPLPSLLSNRLTIGSTLESPEVESNVNCMMPSAASTDTQQNPLHKANEFGEMQKEDCDQSGASKFTEGRQDDRQSMMTSDTVTQPANIPGIDVDNIPAGASYEPRKYGTVKCSQNDDDEEDDEEGKKEGEGESDEHIISHEDCSDSDAGSEYEWIEHINVTIGPAEHKDDQGKSDAAGYCVAKLIRRTLVEQDFHRALEIPSGDTCWLAFDLFDRYGRLKPEFVNHPVIKGSGVWGHELDDGEILIIEEIYVDETHRRQGLDRRMMEALLRVAEQQAISFTAFTYPSPLDRYEISREYDALTDQAARDEMDNRERNRAIAFWRSLGFRRIGNLNWFAMTTNPEHPSRKLASTDDLDLPDLLVDTFHGPLKIFEQISNQPDPSVGQMLSQRPPGVPDFLGALHKCYQEAGPAASCWTSTDKYGNNILHLALKTLNVACVAWILKQDFKDRLLPMRNRRGETPEECLLFHLEMLRTRPPTLSDRFMAHRKEGAYCLLLLQGFPGPKSFVRARGVRALQRLVTGCTCGQCIEGVLSPRTSYILCAQAWQGHDAMLANFTEYSGTKWRDTHLRYLVFLPKKMRQDLNTNKSVREGFANLWKHIAICLEHEKLPIEANVLEALRYDDEWPPAARNFLEIGGKVEHAFLAVCTTAMLQDEITGYKKDAETFGSEFEELPKCRNDREYGFVSGMCRYRTVSSSQFRNGEGKLVDVYGNVVDALR